MKRLAMAAILVSACVSGAVLANAQPRNLLQNPNAGLGTKFWTTFGDASVELMPGDNFCFVVRNGGYLLQDVVLPDDAVGQYAVLIGRGASERINEDGAITGLPYLYGYMMEQGRSEKVLAYLQGQRMLGRTNIRDQWVAMSGIFQVPEGTRKIRFFLNQALRQGVPHNGSAARFTDLGLYLFSSKQEAEAFVG